MRRHFELMRHGCCIDRISADYCSMRDYANGLADFTGRPVECRVWDVTLRQWCRVGTFLGEHKFTTNGRDRWFISTGGFRFRHNNTTRP